MRKGYLAIVFSLVFVNVYSQQEDFELVRKSEEEKIFIHERWIIFPESDPPVKAREVKSDFVIRCTVAEAFALLRNEKKIQSWQDHVTEFKVYPTSDSTYWEEYSYHNIPWPVSDQDHYLQYQIEKISTPDKIHITFKSKVDDKRAPVRDGVTRMTLYGTWTLERVDDNTTSASYRILSKPSSIPRIFTDPVIRNNLMTTIRSLIAVLEKRKE
ncbi:MAG TPA: hypothetical protein VD927_15860 [Chryseosolibacter sp.]|nr:hypothetical protein [Chryseosolibacter sp.]